MTTELHRAYVGTENSSLICFNNGEAKWKYYDGSFHSRRELQHFIDKGLLAPIPEWDEINWAKVNSVETKAPDLVVATDDMFLHEFAKYIALVVYTLSIDKYRSLSFKGQPSPDLVACIEYAKVNPTCCPAIYTWCKDHDRILKLAWTANNPSTTEPATCMDCKGSGKYIGFLEEQTCKMCGGSGRV